MDRTKSLAAPAGSTAPRQSAHVNFLYNLLFCGTAARMRAFDYNRLARLGDVPAARRLLGVIVEVPLDGGLDVLSAFEDGGVRYLNGSGKVAIFDGAGTPVAATAKELFAIARPALERIGPWHQRRLPPPGSGNVGITFLVSDGLYFAEGPLAALEQDAMAGPILRHAARLLRIATEATAG